MKLCEQINKRIRIRRVRQKTKLSHLQFCVWFFILICWFINVVAVEFDKVIEDVKKNIDSQSEVIGSKFSRDDAIISMYNEYEEFYKKSTKKQSIISHYFVT